MGRLRQAPENFLDADDVRAVSHGRREFLRTAFVAALAGAAGGARAQSAAGDPDILNPPAWSTTLGRPVAAMPYGLPSRHEGNLVRRQSPGLT
jgi:sulfane dehydrogenase subunit SoxC